MLERGESVALLRNFRDDLPPDDDCLDAIAEELGDLPLALHQAGSYLARYRNDLVLAIYERRLGPDHPSTRTVRANLQRLLAELARGGAAGQG